MINPTPWRDIDDAIHDWFATSTGLATIWANQDAPQPPWPYGILNRISVAKVGQDGVRYETIDDRVDAHFCGLRSFVVSCQIDLGPLGQRQGIDALAVMGAAQMALALPEYRERFRAVDIAPFDDNEPIQDFDVVVGDVWISRAQMDIGFYTTANVTERGVDAFESVNITSHLDPEVPPSVDLDDENFGG